MSERTSVMMESTSELGQAPAKRWFLVFTKPCGERLACENLQRQGYALYYPQLRQRLPRRRSVERVVSLFPRYVFVRVDSRHQNLTPIRSTLGVVEIVRFGSELAVVPSKVISDLIQRADPETGLHSLDLPALHPGAEVKVTAGVFAGLEGVFQRAAGDERIIVLLKLLGQETQVRIPVDLVCPSAAA